MTTKIMLDSGAFSAWMKQKKISLNDYIQYIKKNEEYVDYIVNLDVIPGSFGKKNLSKKDIKKSAKLGWKNYKKIINSGINESKIIHVFHQDEDFKYLKQMMNKMDYIGISPANDRTTNEKIEWLNKCMKYILNKKGRPIIKFHGFAVTSLPLILKYPWYSIDSTSWVTFGRYGAILMPKTTLGRLDYRKPPNVIFVSDKSTKKDIVGKHIDSVSKYERKKIKEYIEEMGFSFSKLTSDGLERDRFNMKFYLEIEKTLENTRIYFAGNFPMLSKIEREKKTQKIILKEFKNYRRLGSFYYKKYMDKLLEIKKG